MSDSSQLHKVAQRANRMLNVLTEQVQLQKDELHANGTGKIASTDSCER